MGGPTNRKGASGAGLGVPERQSQRLQPKVGPTYLWTAKSRYYLCGWLSKFWSSFGSPKKLGAVVQYKTPNRSTHGLGAQGKKIWYPGVHVCKQGLLWGPMYINRAYFGLFAALGVGFLWAFVGSLADSLGLMERLWGQVIEPFEISVQKGHISIYNDLYICLFIYIYIYISICIDLYFLHTYI